MAHEYKCLTCGRLVASPAAGPIRCGYCGGLYLRALAKKVPVVKQ